VHGCQKAAPTDAGKLCTEMPESSPAGGQNCCQTSLTQTIPTFLRLKLGRPRRPRVNPGPRAGVASTCQARAVRVATVHIRSMKRRRPGR
jgi:hypothetical protein